MNHGGTGEIDMPMAECKVATQRREPSSTPHPVTVERVQKHRNEKPVSEKGRKPPTLGHRSSWNDGCDIHEDRGIKKHGQADGIMADALKAELGKSDEAEVTSCHRYTELAMGDHGGAEGRPVTYTTHHQSITDQPESDEA